MIKNLERRWFLVRNAHDREGVKLMMPRYAMSFMKGPMTRGKLTGETSDRQWRDIAGVLRVTRDVDAAYMRDVASRTGLSVLLKRALLEAAAR